ncbi:MAG: DNA-3-methyladenine glycosylase 2 [Lachnospiraceae bacterium]
MNIETIANSGQCFRFNKVGWNHYELVAKNKVINIYDDGGGSFIFYPAHEWMFDYFNVDLNTEIKNPDPFLLNAILHSPGLTILHQDPWEVLISFIISQRKSIPAIKNSIERLCKSYGTPIDETHYAFPTAEQLMWLNKDECGLGYRKNYIRQLSRNVVDGIFSMEELIATDYDTAKKMLLSIKGVGEKIANCVLLFGLGFDNAFPIDTHIKHILDEHYPDGFPYERYDGQLGLVQQYLFEYDRYLSKKKE